MLANFVCVVATIGVSLCATVPAFAQPSAASQPAVVVDVGYQRETGLGRTGSFHGAAVTLVVPPKGSLAPVITGSVVKRHEQFAHIAVDEVMVSLGLGGRVQLGRGSVRPWLQGVVGVVVDNYNSRSDTGFFSDLGGGLTVDVRSRVGIYLSAGWKPAVLGYVFSGSHVSVGATLALGGR